MLVAVLRWDNQTVACGESDGHTSMHEFVASLNTFVATSLFGCVRKRVRVNSGQHGTLFRHKMRSESLVSVYLRERALSAVLSFARTLADHLHSTLPSGYSIARPFTPRLRSQELSPLISLPRRASSYAAAKHALLPRQLARP